MSTIGTLKQRRCSSEVRKMAKANDNQTQSQTENVNTDNGTVGTAVEVQKQTPQVVAQTNQQRALELRRQHTAELDKLGNNMSAKIRYLHDLGLSMGDTSRVLQIQFQFVRNVVTAYKVKLAKDAQATTPAEAPNAS